MHSSDDGHNTPEMSIVEGGGQVEDDSVVESKDVVRPNCRWLIRNRC